MQTDGFLRGNKMRVVDFERTTNMVLSNSCAYVQFMIDFASNDSQQFSPILRKAAFNVEHRATRGVAKSTVSLALRGHPRISAQQRDRIRSIATEMGYRTNALVARLMHELRSERKQRYIGTLAFINASPLEPSRAQPSSIDENWQAGAGERASQLGYTLDSFRLHDPDVRPQRLARILHARNVQGVVFYSLDNDSKLENCEAVWEGFPCVSIGTRVRNPPLHFVCNDHYTTALHACDALRALGYRRIGLCTVRWLDNVLEHRFVAGYRQAMSLAAEGAEGVELPVFTLHHPHGTMKRHEEEDGRAFQTWVKKYRPGCLSFGA